MTDEIEFTVTLTETEFMVIGEALLELPESYKHSETVSRLFARFRKLYEGEGE